MTLRAPGRPGLLKQNSITTVALLAVLTALAFAVMGYHPGAEDDGVYLAAVKATLHPDLYPHDVDFVRLQTQATLFVPAMAALVRFSHLPLACAEFLGHLLTLFFILYGALKITRLLFPEPRAHWAGVVLLALLFTLPVSGTALYLADQHLHPRNIATALILFASGGVLRRRRWQPIALLLAALLMHPIMAAFGISLCVFIAVAQSPFLLRFTSARSPEFSARAAAAPLGWMFESPSPSWREALSTRSYYFLYRWQWYEWLGALSPLVLFWLLQRTAARRGDLNLSRFPLGVLLYGAFQQVAAMIVLAIPSLVRITPLQPMRYLHLVYILMVLIAGCLLGRHVLKNAPWRWCALVVIAAAAMFIPQRLLFAHTEHIEGPGSSSRNSWLQAFAWIRNNTPMNAYFALDPQYLAAAGNDAHGFRALAERSQLSDGVKDPAVVTQVPQLGPEWLRQQHALAGWEHFRRADFERLRAEFGVTWAVLKNPGVPGLDCVWHNAELTVCRIPPTP